MKVLVAPDKFKGALTAREAAEAIEQGIKAASPQVRLGRFPMADGGEGTMEALVEAMGGYYRQVAVHDPLMRPIKASYAILADQQTAVVEMAAASGLGLLASEDQNCYVTTSYGTGELIKAALDEGVDTIMLTLGGSATSDGGAGMAEALGTQFYAKGEELASISGKDLASLEHIDLQGLDSRLSGTTIKLLCDVDNLLLGNEGAAQTFAPQKGATSTQVDQLEKGLKNLVDLLGPKTNADPQRPGSGAAGGVGFGGQAFLKGTLSNGLEAVIDANGFEKALEHADLVITGEGKLDETTKRGKVVAGIASRAWGFNLAVIALCGEVSLDAETVSKMGITCAQSIVPGPMGTEQALSGAATYLKETAHRLLLLYEHGLESGNSKP
jgi:glycerate kinase